MISGLRRVRRLAILQLPARSLSVTAISQQQRSTIRGNQSWPGLTGTRWSLIPRKSSLLRNKCHPQSLLDYSDSTRSVHRRLPRDFGAYSSIWRPINSSRVVGIPELVRSRRQEISTGKSASGKLEGRLLHHHGDVHPHLTGTAERQYHDHRRCCGQSPAGESEGQ